MNREKMGFSRSLIEIGREVQEQRKRIQSGEDLREITRLAQERIERLKKRL